MCFMTDDNNNPNHKRVFDTTKPLHSDGTWVPKQTQARTRSQRVRPLADYVDNVTKRVLGKRGFSNSRILTDWSLIVGDYLAAQCQPEGIRYRRGEKIGGILHINAYGVQAMELEYLKNQVIEQVNMHMGYAAVGDIKIIQSSAPPPTKTVQRRPIGTKNPPRPLSTAEQKSLSQTLADIEDDALKETLERLGKSVIGDTGSQQ